MKTPILEGDFAPARSYGLIENCGWSKTAVDQTGGDTDLDYYELCLECRAVQPDGRGKSR